MAKCTPSSSRPGHGQVARHARADGQHDGVELLAQLRRRSRRRPTSTPRRSSTPSATSCSTRRSTTRFSILKSGTPKRTRPPAASSRSNSTTRCPARRSCWAAAMPAGPTPTTATLRPVSRERRPGHDPALVPGAVDDRVLDLLDRDRVALADLEHAGGLARRRAQPAGELREVVRRVQLADRVVPAAAVDEVVPVRDQVPQRAAVVAERARRTPCSARPARRARRRVRRTRNSSKGRSRTRSTGSA